MALTIITKIKNNNNNTASEWGLPKFTIFLFLIITHGALDIAYPNSMQDAYYNESRALFHLSKLAGQTELVLIALNGKPKGWFAWSLAWAFYVLFAQRAVVNNVADLVRSFSPTFFAEFLFSEEEKVLFKGCEDEFALNSCSWIFRRRNLTNICRYFDVFRSRGDVFRNHFRVSTSTFEMLCHLLASSEDFPKDNSFGRPRIKLPK